jgi:hypothetical protein
MKKLIISLLLLSSCYSLADDKTEAKARELMATMKITENIEKSFAQISKFSEGIIDSQDLDEEAKEKAKKVAKASTEASLKELATLDWEGIFAEVYSKVFTEEELQGLIDFYNSPIGKKFINKQTDLQVATMNRLQVELAKVMPKIQEDVQKAIQKVKE